MWIPTHRQFEYSFRRKRRYQDEPNVSNYFLSKPKTEKIHLFNCCMNGLEIGHSSIQGYRPSMEDSYCIQQMNLEDHTFVGVFDGHSGHESSLMISEQLMAVLQSTSEWIEYTKEDISLRSCDLDRVSRALCKSFIEMDSILRRETSNSGSTAVCAIISPSHVFVASVGDSRCVIGTSSSVIDMTEDHKPTKPDEASRIRQAGGFVAMGRVVGELAMSRALGDFQYKDPSVDVSLQMVSCVPDISIHTRGDTDSVMLLACDGVFDVMENVDAISFLQDVIDSDTEQATAEQCASALVEVSLAAGSTDNISALVVIFPQNG